MAEDPPTSAAVGPPGPGWHLLSAPVPSADGLPAASGEAMDARAAETVPPDALALPQDQPSGSRRDDVDVGGTVKRGSQSGKPRRRGDGAGGGRGAPLRTTSLTALIEGEPASESQSLRFLRCTLMPQMACNGHAPHEGRAGSPVQRMCRAVGYVPQRTAVRRCRCRRRRDGRQRGRVAGGRRRERGRAALRHPAQDGARHHRQAGQAADAGGPAGALRRQPAGAQSRRGHS